MRFGSAVGLTALALALPYACSVEPLDLAGRTCPCDDGWICDNESNTCVRPDDASLGGSGGSAGSGGGTSGDASLDGDADSGPSAAPLGSTCEGTKSSSGMSLDRKRVTRYVLTDKTAFDALVLYVDGKASTATQVFRGVIYRSDLTTNEPEDLMAESAEATVKGGQAKAWLELPLSPPVTLDPGEYWLGTHSGGTASVAQYSFESQAGIARIADDKYADGAAAKFGSGTVDAWRISIFARPVDVTVSAGGACSTGTGGTSGSGGTGGKAGSGGTAGTGGTSGSGGANTGGSGGANTGGSGGANTGGSGGANSGGASGVGGSTSVGGASATGGNGGASSGSCEGRCGTPGAVPGSSPPCFCDIGCEAQGNCCEDYASACP